jgi:hypothetical protein
MRPKSGPRAVVDAASALRGTSTAAHRVAWAGGRNRHVSTRPVPTEYPPPGPGPRTSLQRTIAWSRLGAACDQERRVPQRAPPGSAVSGQRSTPRCSGSRPSGPTPVASSSAAVSPSLGRRLLLRQRRSIDRQPLHVPPLLLGQFYDYEVDSSLALGNDPDQGALHVAPNRPSSSAAPRADRNGGILSGTPVTRSRTETATGHRRDRGGDR